MLKKHWPHVKQYEDIKGLNYERLKADGLFPIDIITGGYPCQPFSVAGRKKGEEDPRHLWPEMFRLIKELRPSWVIGENVSGHIKLGLDTVLKNLESEGYSARTFSISASSVGANHKRERVWIVANARQHERGFQPSGNQESIGPRTFEKTKRSSAADKTSRSSTREETLANAERIGQQRQGKPVRPSSSTKDSDGQTSWSYDGSQRAEGWWNIEPNVGRVAHGVPKRVDRLKSLGNSVVPQIPFLIGLAIRRTIESDTTTKQKI